MKKKLLIFSSIIILAIAGVVYGLNRSSTSDCSLAGTKACSKKECCAKNEVKQVAENKEDSKLAGKDAKTGCPMIGECCKNH